MTKIILKKNIFILAGNGSYKNRGCEAIVRGTIAIIRKYYDDPQFIVCSQFKNEDHLKDQQKEEIDTSVIHLRMRVLPFLRTKYLNKIFWKIYRLFPSLRRKYIYQEIIKYIPDARGVLSIGGDNYSLDYHSLEMFIDLDDLIESKRKKLIIWGASVGPFSRSPKVERFMEGHLKKQTAIMARETKTIDYLKNIHIEKNVYKVIDPAFAMTPLKPQGEISYGDLTRTIGVNFSPLMARFINHFNIYNFID
jgi:colanic acid/amylovoran biosynthesis protein